MRATPRVTRGMSGGSTCRGWLTMPTRHSTAKSSWTSATRLATEKEIDLRDRAAEEEKIKASRAGDKERVRELAHLNGEFDRERGEGFVRDFLMPVLTNLAQKKAGSDAK